MIDSYTADDIPHERADELYELGQYWGRKMNTVIVHELAYLCGHHKLTATEREFLEEGFYDAL